MSTEIMAPTLSTTEILIFFRAEGWYPISAVRGVPLHEQAEQHATCNPGTLRVEDGQGTVLWRLQ